MSKDNLGHGVIHWLADQNATLYVRREERRNSKAQALTIAKALEGEQPLTLFPEGTTGPGDQLRLGGEDLHGRLSRRGGASAEHGGQSQRNQMAISDRWHDGMLR